MTWLALLALHLPVAIVAAGALVGGTGGTPNPVGQALSGPTAAAIAVGWFLAAPFIVLSIPSVRGLRDAVPLTAAPARDRTETCSR